MLKSENDKPVIEPETYKIACNHFEYSKLVVSRNLARKPCKMIDMSQTVSASLCSHYFWHMEDDEYTHTLELRNSIN